MSKQMRYQKTMGALTPPPDWKRRTLAAMHNAECRRHPVRHPLRWAVAAALVLALAAGGELFLTSQPLFQPAGPGVALTPAPIPEPTPTEWVDDHHGMQIVTNPAQQMGDNPTDGCLDQITELPVYSNHTPDDETQLRAVRALAEKLGLTSPLVSTHYETSAQWDNVVILEACFSDGSILRLSNLCALEVTFARPPQDLPSLLSGLSPASEAGGTWITERMEQYAYSGQQHLWQGWYYHAPDAPLSQQLFDYSFRRTTSNDTGDYSSLRLNLPPEDAGVSYPLRTQEEAVAAFRSGHYWGTVTNTPAQANILQVVLEYAAEPYQDYFQPVYRILYTQDTWDLSGVMDDPDRYTSVSFAYVPAVAEEYESLLNYQLFLNE